MEDSLNIHTPRHQEHTSGTPIAFFEQYFKGDKILWMVIFALALISILVVYSATGTLAYKSGTVTENYLLKHTILMVLALLTVWLAHRVDYRYYARLSRLALLASPPLLLMAWYFGVNVNEANRWINIPLIRVSFQPSDLAKLALISNIAGMLSKRQGRVDDFQETVLPILIWTGIICTLIGLANVSNALLLFITSLILMFIGRVPVSQLAMLCLVGIVSMMLSLYLGQRFETVVGRITDFFNTEQIHPQAEQSYIAIANGGLIGRGPGNSVQRNFLPQSFSDYVYAILIEEYGLLGGGAVLGLYLLLLYRGVQIVLHSRQAFGGILAAGLTLSLVLQAFLNMGVAVGLLPITGVPLPLLSMGGTSLLFTGLALGIILSVSRGEIDKDIELMRTTSGEAENLYRSRD